MALICSLQKTTVQRRFGAHGAGTTGTIPAISDAGDRVGTYIHPYEPGAGSGSAVGARGERRQTPHTILLVDHIKRDTLEV